MQISVVHESGGGLVASGKQESEIRHTRDDIEGVALEGGKQARPNSAAFSLASYRFFVVVLFVFVCLA